MGTPSPPPPPLRQQRLRRRHARIDQMTADVYIADACRTPVGKLGGVLAHVRPDDLAAHAISSLMARNPVVDPSRVADVVWGAANQAGEDNRNVGRMAALLGGLGDSVPGVTVNRLCGSGLQAVWSAAQEIRWGAADDLHGVFDDWFNGDECVADAAG